VVARAHVAARDEHVPGAGDQEPRNGRVAVGDVDRASQPEVHGGGHRVALFGAVDHTPRQRSMALEAQMRRGPPVALRGPRCNERTRRSYLSTLPDAFNGSASTTSTKRGTL